MENIAYRDTDGKMINIVPPSIEKHTYWLDLWLTTVEKATGITVDHAPGVYTRADYWDAWVKGSDKWSHFPLWIASWTNYSAFIRLPRDWKNWRVWQKEGGTGRQDGVTGPVDKNEFNGDQAQMVAYYDDLTQPTENNLINTYKSDVKVEDRAFGITLSRDDPRENMPLIAANTNFAFLQLGGNDGLPGSGEELYSDGDTFRIRAERAAANNLPVLGWFNVDAGYPLWKQKSNTYHEYENRPYTEREGLKTILETWRKPGTFSWGLKADDGNWLPMNGIVLCMYKTQTHTGQAISGLWQTWVLDDTIKYLNIFMEGGYIPKVPIYVYSNPGFFETYKDTLGLYLKNRLDAGEINGIGYGMPLYPQVPTSETLTLADVSTLYRYTGEYKYPYILFGFEGAIKFFTYSWDRFKVKEVMERDGSPRTVSATTWCDTKEKLYEEIGFVYTPPLPPVDPPVEPPVDPPAPEEPPTTEEEKVNKILEIVQAIYDMLKKFYEWMTKFQA